MFIKPLNVYRLYGAPPPEERDSIFEQTGGVRKCIVATNIAETSITVEGVVFVVDAGYRKQKRFVPEEQCYRFEAETISQAAAEQRKVKFTRSMYVQYLFCFRAGSAELRRAFVIVFTAKRNTIT